MGCRILPGSMEEHPPLPRLATAKKAHGEGRIPAEGRAVEQGIRGANDRSVSPESRSRTHAM